MIYVVEILIFQSNIGNIERSYVLILKIIRTLVTDQVYHEKVHILHFNLNTKIISIHTNCSKSRVEV